MTKKEILNAFRFRHACKIFDEAKKIPKEDLEFILETGRLSPSSFGMEQWKFIVVQNEALKAKIRPHCWNQVQITSCSDLVVILAKKILRSNHPYVKEMLEYKGWDEARKEAYLKRYSDHNDWRSDEELIHWSMKQCYIAAANMMTSAAMIGIDSCPMEGMDKKKVQEAMGIDTAKYEIALLVSFGYRLNPQPEKLRLPMEKIAEFR